MAIDAWLLDGQGAVDSAAAAVPAPAFRLYRWLRPTLSLGWHQRHLEPHWWDLARQGRLDLVRRPSGGRAVLHGGDLTYALVWPRPQGTRAQVYGQALAWLIEAFAAMGQPLLGGSQAASLQRSSCFATSTAADLVHANGAKRVGSAQLWRAGHLLQHGSIQLDPCPVLWREVFGDNPPDLDPLPLAAENLEQHLYRSAGRWLPPLEGNVGERMPLSPAALATIAPHLERYRVTLSVSGDTSPELTMPRAT
ncbi:lipoyl protein ligase domain-containing protein [Synechococcus sp. CS-1332]|uniref:lipoyl protein ligase domain-containing protein n=1 Tax=Synechococcus sp. CS-1332 TaxID=2847972 RepID=UPI00223C2AD9|nr:lipoate--protein ligase family protein [Synechococcus sp. CS-1332]MCT0207833.1 lipoate--protein ligase family protein [Synechococcus sp. CS-1332]